MRHFLKKEWTKFELPNCVCPGVTGQLRYWSTKPSGLWGTPYPSAGNNFQTQAASFVYPTCVGHDIQISELKCLVPVRI